MVGMSWNNQKPQSGPNDAKLKSAQTFQMYINGKLKYA